MKWNLIDFKRIGLFCSFLFLIINCNISQNNNDNHRKYWYYRSRLVNDFMKVGLGQGESLIFNQRGYESNTQFNDGIARLKIGDGTSTLGYYIAMLATEYYLLSQNNQNTNKVKHELFCALNAINRLDAVAENLDHNNLTPLNGFFVRDDISKYMIDNEYYHFNYFDNGGSWNNNGVSRGFASKMQAGSKEIKSSWQNYVEDGKPGLFFESQDQVYNLLFGIAFINKFVPESETDGGSIFGYGSGESSLTKEARNIAARIIDHIRDSKNVTGTSSCAGWSSVGWKIHNPSNCNPVNLGADATVFAYPLAEIECMMKNGISVNNSTNFSIGSTPRICSGNGYHNTWSNTLGYTTWNAVAPSITPKIDLRVFIENLSAVCNCVYGTRLDAVVQTYVTALNQSPITSWLGFVIGWIYNIVTSVVNTFVPGVITNETSTAINVNAYTPNTPLDHGPLARKILHGGAYLQNPNHTVEYLINSAPCDDIYAFKGGYFGHQEWSSSDRLDHPERMWGNSGFADFNGEFPAVDYMLYHNLWYIHKLQGGVNQNVVDLSDVIIYNQNNMPCHNVNAYETITVNASSIGCNSEIAWRAGKTIYFGSGTSITGNGSSTTGPNFHAYIQKFDCATDVGVYKLAQDSTSPKLNSLANDAYANDVVYHTVNYPQNELQEIQAKNNVNEEENLITELPTDEDILESVMKTAYPNYSNELFVRPTVTQSEVRAYFKLQDGEQAFLHVIDINGREVYVKNNLTNSDKYVIIDLSGLASGTYLLKYNTTNGTSKTEKIIKL